MLGMVSRTLRYNIVARNNASICWFRNRSTVSAAVEPGDVLNEAQLDSETTLKLVQCLLTKRSYNEHSKSLHELWQLLMRSNVPVGMQASITSPTPAEERAKTLHARITEVDQIGKPGFEALRQIIQRIKYYSPSSAKGSFVHIGSGSGESVLAASLLRPDSLSSIGFEPSHIKHDKGIQKIRALETFARYAVLSKEEEANTLKGCKNVLYSDVNLFCKDAVSDPSLWTTDLNQDINRTTNPLPTTNVIFVDPSCFSKSDFGKISKAAENLSPGTFIVSMSEHIQSMSGAFQTLERRSIPLTCGNTGNVVVQQRLDSSVNGEIKGNPLAADNTINIFSQYMPLQVVHDSDVLPQFVNLLNESLFSSLEASEMNARKLADAGAIDELLYCLPSPEFPQGPAGIRGQASALVALGALAMVDPLITSFHNASNGNCIEQLIQLLPTKTDASDTLLHPTLQPAAIQIISHFASTNDQTRNLLRERGIVSILENLVTVYEASNSEIVACDAAKSALAALK